MRISEIMTSDPACCSPETKLTEVAKLMLTCDCGCIPVCDSEESKRVIGVVTDRDIAIRAVASGRDIAQLKASDVMSHPIVTLQAEEPLESALKMLEENQIRRAPVVDSTGRLIGMVAQADVARAAPMDKVAELVQSVSKSDDYGHRML